MREGDYLRQQVDLDDEDDEQTTTGCFRFPKSRSLSHIVKSSRLSESHDSPTMTSSPSSRIGRIAEKSVHFFRNTHSDSSMAAKRKPASPPGSCSGQQGRRFMRVVRDENAPPPDACSDNPNTVCRYSQDYLREYYSKKREVEKTSTGCEKPALPYTTSGHTILKKSLTDPSSERPTGGSSSAPTVAMATKHATFNDVVTIFDIVQRTVTTEHIRDEDCLAAETVDNGDLSREQSGEFFLASSEVTVSAEPSESDLDVQATGVPMATEEDRTDSDETVAAAMVTSKPSVKCEPNAMQNIFASFTEPPPALGFDSGSKLTTRPQIRRVKLENLMEQARVSVVTSEDNGDNGR